MSYTVRPLERADLPSVAGLRRRLFRHSRGQTDAEVADYLERVFLENPWYDPDLPPLVLETGSTVVGFLGVIPRPLVHAGEMIRGALLTQFVVEPAYRKTGAIRLLTAGAAAGQEVTFADTATRGVVRIWEGRFGSMATIYRFHWRHPLWTTRLAALPARGSTLARTTRGAVRGLARVADGIAVRVQQTTLDRNPPRGEAVRLDVEELMSVFASLAGSYSVYLGYNALTFSWILERAREKWGSDKVHARAVRDAGETVGCFVFTLGADGTAQILYALAAPDRQELLADHVLYAARAVGAAAVESRLDPVLGPVAEQRQAAFTSRGFGVVIAAKNPEVFRSFMAGRALITGLDGEWWIDV